MLGEICAEVKNYFVKDGDIHIGDWVISNGTISPALDLPTKYFRVVGSRLNDGVHEITQQGNGLVDESFHGAIWIMSPPADFISLAAEIKAWQVQNGQPNSTNMSPFQSESFGGYSYSKGGAGANSSSAIPTWKSQYAGRLNRFRKIREL